MLRITLFFESEDEIPDDFLATRNVRFEKVANPDADENTIAKRKQWVVYRKSKKAIAV